MLIAPPSRLLMPIARTVGHAAGTVAPLSMTESEKVRLNLGAGPDRRTGWINVDVDASHSPDVVWDLNKRPYPFEDGSIDHIYAAQLLEHLQLHCVDFFQETYRILESDGTLEMVLPNMFSLKNRMLYLVGRCEESAEWNPYHVKLVHPLYLLRLARHVGFDAQLAHGRVPRFPRRYLFADYIWIKARKRR